MITWFLGTVRRDGRPHSAGVGAMWNDGGLYFTSGPGTPKSHDLASNPAASHIAKYYAVFWTPAAIAALVSGCLLAKPVARLLAGSGPRYS
jgi:hypothetical protein